MLLFRLLFELQYGFGFLLLLQLEFLWLTIQHCTCMLCAV
jgi:hypothetical protein